MPAFAQMESETKIQSVVALPRPACFCLEQSLFCGQAFRWERKEGAFFGVAGDRVLTVAQTETQLLFYNASRRDVREFWVPYFSLDEDYPAVNALFARDPLLREAGLDVAVLGTALYRSADPREDISRIHALP